MTTPNLPWDTTDPADLPQGVIAPSQAGTALQDQSQQKFTDVAASKFPAIASNTAAGSPSGGGVMGFVVSKFSQITSNVANADPATINKPDDVVNLAGNFFSGLPLISFIGDIVGAITGIVGGGFNTLTTFFSQLLQAGQGIPIVGPITQGIYNFFFHQAAVANSAAAAATQAQGALDAATAADKKITALIQGGTRTVYTSNFTYTPSAETFKIGVLLYGGGRQGQVSGWGSPGGVGGGLIYAEFLVANLPTGGISVSIGAGGSSGPGVSSPTTFGSLLSSADSGGGQLQNSTLLALSASVFPGAGGTSGNVPAQSGSAQAGGSPGGSSALAAGGSTSGAAGANAPVTGQFLAGGGGGAGGYASNAYFGPASNGGAGGFPGGGGGGAGRNFNEYYWVGGYGAPGLCAIIEFKAAA